MAANYLPLFRPGQTVTFGVTTAVTAGSLVEVGAADWAVQPAADGSTSVVGVAGHDAGVGDKVTVEVGRVIHEFTAQADITRGGPVAPAGAGAVKPAAEATPFGIALASAAADALVPVVQA